LQVLKNRMTRLRIAAGAVMVREADPAQCYYIIEQGRFRLGRRLRPRGQETVLMEAGPGDGIGESGLIADGRFGITATALEDSWVACISKGEFLTLLLRPHVKSITYSEALLRQQAGAVLLDVRPFRAYHRSRLPGGVNLPLKVLRQTARLLDRNHEYIVYADKPQYGTTAAFLLACQGIESRLLIDAASAARHGNTDTGIRGFTPLHV
jgi:CRP-like cAMP-binding protein